MARIHIHVDTTRLMALLRELPQRIQRKAVMSGLRDASRFLQRALRAAAPRRTGKTARFIVAGRVRQEGPVFSVRIRRPIIYNILESGVAAREIVPRSRKALVFGEERFAARVQHPGFPGRSHIWGPVVQANEASVERIFGQKVEEVVREARSG